MQKYIGLQVEIIYLDQTNRVTQRRVKVISVAGHFAKCFCMDRQAPRAFDLDRVLAVRPIHAAAKRHG